MTKGSGVSDMTEDHYNPDQEDIIELASDSIEWTEEPDGNKLICFVTPFFYGDKIQFDSVNGKGIGFIDGITLAADGSVYYTVVDAENKGEEGDSIVYGGIYPEDITLLEKGIEDPE